MENVWAGRPGGCGCAVSVVCSVGYWVVLHLPGVEHGGAGRHGVRVGGGVMAGPRHRRLHEPLAGVHRPAVRLAGVVAVGLLEPARLTAVPSSPRLAEPLGHALPELRLAQLYLPSFAHQLLAHSVLYILHLYTPYVSAGCTKDPLNIRKIRTP